MSVANDGGADRGFLAEHFAERIEEQLEALGRLGLSAPAVQDLRELFVDDAEGVPLEAHTLALGGLSLLWQARNAAGVTEAPFAGSATESSAPRVIPLHTVDQLPAVEAAPEPAPQIEAPVVDEPAVASELPVVPANKLEVPTSEPTASLEMLPAGSLHIKGRTLLRSVLGNIAIPETLTQQEGEAFLEQLFAQYAAARRTYGDNHTLVIQKQSLLQHARGKTAREISQQLDISLATATNTNRRFNELLQKKYGSEALQQAFEQFLSTKVIEGSSLVQVMPTPKPEAALPTVVTPPPAAPERSVPEVSEAASESTNSPEVRSTAVWLRHIASLVEPHWNAVDRQGLMQLLQNEKGDAVEQARYHLAALLSVYVPTRPVGNDRDATLLSGIEWDTLNNISGYRLSQSDLPAQPRYIYTRLGNAYRKDGRRFEEVFDTALTTLLRKAAKDYEQNWYPGLQRAQADISESEPRATDTSELLVDEASRSIAAGVRKLIGNTDKLNEDHVEILVKHLSGHTVDVPAERLLRLTTFLAARVERAHRQAMRARSNGGHAQLITSDQNELLKELFGSISPYRVPKTVGEIAQHLRRDQGAKNNTGQIVMEVGKALRTLSRH